MSWRVKLNLATVGLVGAAAFFYAFTTLFQLDFIEKPYYVTATFDETSLLARNAEVAFQGVRSGQVSRIELTPSTDGAVVTLRLQQGARIPRDSTATITRKSPIGQPIVALRPPDDWEGDGPFLGDGDRIPRSATSAIFAFETVLDPLTELLEELDPEHTGTLFDELAAAVEGRALDMRRLNTANAQILSTLAERRDHIERLIGNATTIAETVVEHRTAFGDGITNLRDVSVELRAARDDLATFLEEGAAMSREAAALARNRKPELDCALTDLEHLMALLGTREQLENTIGWIENMESVGVLLDANVTLSDGREYVQGGIIFSNKDGPVQYEEPATLPPVIEVEPCR